MRKERRKKKKERRKGEGFHSQGCVRAGDKVSGCLGGAVDVTHLSLQGLAQALLSKGNEVSP